MGVNLILLAATILVAIVNATSIVAGPKLITPDFSVPASRRVDQEDLPSKRFLKSHKPPTAASGEERAGIFSKFNLGFLDDIVDSTQAKFLLEGLKKKGADADDVFKILHVDKVTDNLLASKEFQLLEKYVKMTTQTDPEEAIAGALTANLGGNGFSKMIAAAFKNSNTKDIASKLEEAQLTRWLNRDYSPIDILKAQKLDKVDDVFDIAPLTTYINYLTAYNTKIDNAKRVNIRNPKKTITFADSFTEVYSQEGFYKLLASADEATSAGATKFKEEVVKSWMSNPNHPTTMFKLLKLDEAGDSLLTSPLLSTWTQYMKAFNEQFPHSETTMIKTFTKIYGDENLASMIQKATKVEETKEFAKNLQTAQFNQWMAEKKTPDVIYKQVLKLHSTDSPNAEIWRAYYNAYDKQFKGQLFAFKP